MAATYDATFLHTACALSCLAFLVAENETFLQCRHGIFCWPPGFGTGLCVVSKMKYCGGTGALPRTLLSPACLPLVANRHMGVEVSFAPTTSYAAEPDLSY